MNKDVDSLREEQSNDWIDNPIKVLIQDLFKEELSESNYRKMTPDFLVETVQKKFACISDVRYKRIVSRLISKIKKCKDVKEQILALGEYLIGE